jgi:small subunit ribosomal protein S16
LKNPGSSTAGAFNCLTPIDLSANIQGMLKIRLQRVGRVNNPSFRVVLTESTNSAQSGKFQEILGFYDPKSGKVELKSDRIKYWISVGAQVSGTVHNFLVDNKIVEAKKVNVMPKRTIQSKKE